MPFTEACRDVSAGNRKIAASDFLDQGRLPIVDQGERPIAGFTNDLAAAVETAPPIIVYGDHSRRVKYVDHQFAVGAEGVKLLKPTHNFDARYLYRYLASVEIPSAGYSRHFKFLRSIEVPCPPLEEQRQIADVLDRADALRAKRRETLASLDELTESIFVEMFGSPFDQGIWPQRRLKDLGRVVTGRTPKAAVRDAFGSEVPFVTPGDLERDGAADRYLSAAGAETVPVVPDGSLLVCCIGATVGKMSMATCRSAFNQQINAVEWGDKVAPFFGYEAMRTRRPAVIAAATATTLPIVNKSTFELLEVPVPPMALQEKFAAHCRQIGGFERTIRDQARVLDELFASLQQRAFRGDLLSSPLPPELADAVA